MEQFESGPKQKVETTERLAKEKLDFYKEQVNVYLTKIEDEIEKNENSPVNIAIIHDFDADGLSAGLLWHHYLQHKFGERINLENYSEGCSGEGFEDATRDTKFTIIVDKFFPEVKENQEDLKVYIETGGNVLHVDHHTLHINEEKDDTETSTFDPTIPEHLGRWGKNRTGSHLFVAPDRMDSEMIPARYTAGQLSRVLIQELLGNDDEGFMKKYEWLIVLSTYGDTAQSEWLEFIERVAGKDPEMIKKYKKVASILQLVSEENAPAVFKELLTKNSVEEILNVTEDSDPLLFNYKKSAEEYIPKIAENIHNKNNDDKDYLIIKYKEEIEEVAGVDKDYVSPKSVINSLCLPENGYYDEAPFKDRIICVALETERNGERVIRMSFRFELAAPENDKEGKYDLNKMFGNEAYGEIGDAGGGHKMAMARYIILRDGETYEQAWDRFEEVKKEIIEKIEAGWNAIPE